MATKKTTPAQTAAKPASKAPARAPTRAPAKAAAKPAAKAAPKKAAPIAEKYTKTQITTEIADSTGLTKKQVSDVIDSLSNVIERHLHKRGAGEFVLPGILKIKTVKKPARKARKGVNPFTGEETTFKAKPASIAVKVQPLKKLKDMAN